MQGYPLPVYTVVDIDEGRLGSVYPLVRIAMPEISPAQWATYARELARRGWVLGLSGPDESLFGFLTCRVERTLRHGPVLHVDNFIVFELGRMGLGRRLLLEAAEARARKEGCAVSELRLSARGHGGDERGLAQSWSKLDYWAGDVLLMKPVELALAARAGKCPAVAIGA